MDKLPALISVLHIIVPLNCQVNNADVDLVISNETDREVNFNQSAFNREVLTLSDTFNSNIFNRSIDSFLRKLDERDGRFNFYINLANNASRTFTNLLCRSYVLKLGQNTVKVSNRPHGTCRVCCPIRRNKDVRFILFKRNKPNVERIMLLPNKVGNARKSGVNNKLKTVIFIHGFSENSPGPSSLSIKNAYFARNLNVNFIILDWSELSQFPWYSEAVDNLKFVWIVLVKFLQTYNDSGEIPISNVHIIGFSLGAQIAGITGKKLRNNLKIPRITALDPAFPMFTIEDPDGRLTDTDATYVDVIHTDGGLLGYPISLGHADFYPNGGHSIQPGCQASDTNNLINRVLACNHLRAWKYYAESVRKPLSFPSTKCDDWLSIDKTCNFTLEAYMGYSSNLNTTFGNFYLLTNDIYPYSLDVEEQKQFYILKKEYEQ